MRQGEFLQHHPADPGLRLFIFDHAGDAQSLSLESVVGQRRGHQLEGGVPALALGNAARGGGRQIHVTGARHRHRQPLPPIHLLGFVHGGDQVARPPEHLLGRVAIAELGLQTGHVRQEPVPLVTRGGLKLLQGVVQELLAANRRSLLCARLFRRGSGLFVGHRLIPLGRRLASPWRLRLDKAMSNARARECEGEYHYQRDSQFG